MTRDSFPRYTGHISVPPYVGGQCQDDVIVFKTKNGILHFALKVVYTFNTDFHRYLNRHNRTLI